MPSNSNQRDDFQAVQRAFTRHLRDPSTHAAPDGIEERRIQIYRDLIYNNIQDFLANSFPVIRKLLDDRQWHDLMRDYVASHLAQTPLFPRMPQEFLRYLEEGKDRIPTIHPWLAELAHYEWLEISIALDTREVETDNINAAGDLMNDIPVMNPVAVPAAYHWPVHRISPDFQPGERPDTMTYLLVYRKAEYEIGFMELNPLSARLVEKLLDNNGNSGKTLLLEIGEEIQHPDQDVILSGGLEILETLREKSVLLGTRE